MLKYAALPVLFLIFIFLGCDQQATNLEAGQEWAHLTGTVKYAENLLPVNMAFVRTQNHMETTETDSTGEYDLSIALPKDQQESVILEIYKEGYLTLNLQAIIAAGQTSPIPTVTLERYLDSTITDTTYTGSGPPEGIVVFSIEPDTLSVTGVGGSTISHIVCEVQDASGRAVDTLHTAQVLFDFQLDPGGGAYIYPTSDVTDDSGRVATDFYSGTDAGMAIIKVQFASSSTFIIVPEITIFQTGEPASITLESIEYDSVAVQGTGANEVTTATFVVRDAGGSPLSASQPTEVNFEILGPTGGGEYLYPEMDTTDVIGQVSTTLNSGTVAGTVQLRAYIVGTDTISCTPVPITIHSGLPDPVHFGVYPRYVNFPGYNYFGREDSIIAIVGDQYSNPVPSGTAVYFSTDAGIIEGSAVTDTAGFATVRLFSGPPVPSPLYPFGLITAQTVGEGGTILTTNTEVLFSGMTQIELDDTLDFVIDDGNSKTYDFRVSDQHGYPISYGSKIEVSATAGGVLGDVDVTYPDTQDTTSWTNFSFVIYDNNPGDPDPAVLAAVTIMVTSANGDASMIINGTID
ncbi:hypothetical protein CEE37_10675 [candidate division LCP-89 bacterium B3_LCP]|uniref:Big-1 domain-containing protein n=1 Tax=candidate division LCP-89 bacterium B3_LCP TaxID=2012998 RepID=A0A532UXR7_UNCL8|nr:MAG: hypothetical protein CEE37_10675 [candidate division LCP-89 bacterium B3_LCP]